MSAIIPAAIAAGADILGGFLGMSGQSAANQANLQIARENRAFQERMSNTAYQRAAKDLEAAGLNRILALGNPASSPSGTTAQMQNVKAPLAAGISKSIHTALAVRAADAQIKNINAQTRNTDENTNLTAIRGLIATHGEEVASVAADIARTVRALTGNKSPVEVAKIIQTQIDKASGALTNALEKMGNTGKDVKSGLQTLRDDITTFVLDQIDQAKSLAPQGPQSRADREAQWRRETAGKDISYEQWKKSKGYLY